jgi:hypothetical protein
MSIFRTAFRRWGLRVVPLLGCVCGALVLPAGSYAFPPVNTSPPTIAGTAQQGRTLTEGHGSWWNGPAAYAYQWLRCTSAGSGCAPIAKATAQTYLPVGEDVGHRLRVQETASNFSGSSSPAESAATAVVLPAVPEDTSRPTIAGTAQLGLTLTEVHGSWTNSPTAYTYQWLRCSPAGAGCTPIAGATAQSYVPLAADVGHGLRVTETASNAGGPGSPAESSAPAVVNTTPATAATIPGGSVTLDRQGDAMIPLGCPATATAGCHGTITIRITEPHARRASAARCGRGCRPIGSAKYEARAGQKIRIRVHIASYGRRLVRQRHSLRATLTATSISGLQTVTVVRTIGLRAG